MILTSTKRKRFVVLGLDGLPASLAVKMAARLPNLNRIAGKNKPLTAETPELSPVNWTSFFTAAGPETHGVYGFTKLDRSSYTLSINNFDNVYGSTLFDRIGEKGLVSKVINLPNTYPARPLRGMLISGFVADSLEKAVYPPFLLAPLKKSGFILEADTSKGLMDPQYLIDQVSKTLECRLNAFEMLWNDLAWDLFVIVFTETDRLFHFLYPAFEDTNHPLHNVCMNFMIKWDAAIGRVLDKFDALPGDKKLISFADHGFTSLETEVDLNAFLIQKGLLSLKHIPSDQWDSTAISDESKAFALDPGRIYIHTAERFDRGQVSKDEIQSITETIAFDLMELKFNGQQVMESVQTTAELYGETAIGNPPDLICTAKPGFDLKAKFDRKDIFGFFGRTGTHTREDAFFYSSDGEQADLMRDTGKMILNWFNISPLKN
ncbi:Predicted phosphohydrolase or phosphomutase, AlkP superfamily [Maridesulfovibrio ferrireducens]|uniref:Predicted phosphohydrolase or phosphomutase, AlkP superfamily n=1 Tax=Maridesulfovibrio ferrireducens TaxID=246191 RepID=A0A1G9HKI9_9BACT|nr:alkaline phosphatase family protein [Maridesulfovibrio ferrireducens]SDL13395.1 Predicted phosphohydrolase or phosphomutase, AlkP superfamily [Maridesulfovibrio ferrireducens]